MSIEVGLPICRWTLDGFPHLGVRIDYDTSGTKRVATLFNTITETRIEHQESLDATATFELCVWKSNDWPRHAPIAARLFRSKFGQRATWVGIDLTSTPKLRIFQYNRFDDNVLQDKALVYNHTSNQVELQRAENDGISMAEQGMIRSINRFGEAETVHIWERIGQNGANDLRLIHKKVTPLSVGREELCLQIFYRATRTEALITLSNPPEALTAGSIETETRIANYINHPVAILGGRSGNSYSTVTLLGERDYDKKYKGFFGGKNLQAAQMGEIATYVRDQLFILRDSKGNQISSVQERSRVEVSYKENYDFGREHNSLDAIHIHISQHRLKQYFALPAYMLMAFVSGIFNRNAPIIHQLRGLNETGMENLLIENTDPLHPLNKQEIFNEFDKAIAAGKNVDLHIAVNRKTARFKVESVAFNVRSAAVTVGRALALRPVWEGNNRQAVPDNNAAAMMFDKSRSLSSNGKRGEQDEYSALDEPELVAIHTEEKG